MYVQAGALAKSVLTGANVDFRVAEGRPRASEMGLLLGGECDALALWWGHAEAIYTNPCDHGAALHPLCTKGTLSAFEVGHRLLKDPQGQSVVTAPHSVQATLAAHAEHHGPDLGRRIDGGPEVQGHLTVSTYPIKITFQVTFVCLQV